MPTIDTILRVAERYEQIIKKEAESSEHLRIKGVLTSLATTLGYVDEASLASGLRPDVLRIRGKDRLFLADAKVASSETSCRTESATRIEQYVQALASLVESGKVQGCVLGVATDDEQEAQGWAALLNVLCWKHGVFADDGSTLVFRVSSLDPKTWFASN